MPPFPITGFRASGVRAACAALLAALAVQAGDERTSGFDGFEGFLASHYERNEGPSGNAGPALAAENGFTGLVNLQLHVRSVEFRAGLGGVFSFPQFREKTEGFGGSRHRWFLITVSELNARLRFGPPGSPEGLQAGFFRLQANPDAALFGNFLARYGAYEKWSGNPVPDWDSLGSLVPLVDGIRFTSGVPGAALRSDVIAIHEMGVISFLGFLSGPGRPGMEWGVGVNFHRALSLGYANGESRTYANGYVKSDTGYIPLAWALRDTVARPPEDTGYYTAQAFMVSARASVDFGRLTGGDGRGWKDVAFFAEAALLGWADQPIVFEDRLRRLAWTVGARLPAFGLLDVFTVQWEWRPEAYHPSDRAVASGWVGEVLSPGNPLSPWSAGILLSKNLGMRFALQGRVLAEPVPAWPGYFYFRQAYETPVPASRQVRMMIRGMYRLP